MPQLQLHLLRQLPVRGRTQLVESARARHDGASHKYLHDQLRCDLERVGVVGGAEADDKELSGIDQMVGTVEQLAPWSGSARLWRARQCQRLRMVCVRVRFNTGFTTLGPKARLARIARSMLSLALRSYIVYALL